jgi:hypothetical protein
MDHVSAILSNNEHLPRACRISSGHTDPQNGSALNSKVPDQQNAIRWDTKLTWMGCDTSDERYRQSNWNNPLARLSHRPDSSKKT